MYLPLQLNASAGHKANLTCSVSGIPRPVITWFKDGSQVPPSLIREFKGYSMLAFHSVSLRNQGRYWCEASNSEGWNRSSPVNLTGTSRLQSIFFSQLINLCFPVVVCRFFSSILCGLSLLPLSLYMKSPPHNAKFWRYPNKAL